MATPGRHQRQCANDDPPYVKGTALVRDSVWTNALVPSRTMP
ncbi:hypothetical protein RBSWK_04208 [Rhodopirellula baltica SWK14]|uniref:Uncharacterized protein n=1 Tax=Rhodopirellula baltica SWK14 TaxID=993516 RepID=L7CDI9_RHOBT|nr:hypothetical protein RBSWK_04208 [Rhodopirellula baltica SWK14]